MKQNLFFNILTFDWRKSRVRINVSANTLDKSAGRSKVSSSFFTSKVTMA